MSVPKLRFPEFNGEWEEKKLEETALFTRGPFGGALKKSIFVDYGYKVYEQKNAIQNSLDVGDYYIDEKKYKEMIRFSVKEGDLLVSCSGTIGRILIIPENYPKGIINQALLKVTPNDVINNIFLKELLQNSNKTKYLFGGRGAAIKNIISVKELKSIKIPLPSFEEQSKIASFLLKVDEKVEKLEKKQKLWFTYKKGMIQQIFSQKLRFQDENGEYYPDWEDLRFFDILFEHKTKSTGKEEVFSVSVHKGLINQVEHLGRTFAAPDTSKYNLVKPGDIVYTKSPTGDFPLGIIKQSKISKNVIVSPLYGVFSPLNKDLGFILDSYFESPINTRNYLHPIVQKGAKNTMNITNATFLSRSLTLPTNENEQEKIANLLSVIDYKINLIGKELESEKEFKKGLLQKMVF